MPSAPCTGACRTFGYRSAIPVTRSASPRPSTASSISAHSPRNASTRKSARALCTFFPNFVLPETFGLVFAESRAVGTPILTCDCGAAAEIVGDPQQVLPVTFGQRAYEATFQNLSPGWRRGPARVADSLGLFDAYIERIRAWRAGGRPATGPDPRFRLSQVADQWRAMLGIQ